MGDLHHWFPIIPIQHDQYHDLDYHLRSTILRQIRLNKEYIQAYTYLYLPIFTIYLSFFLSLSIYNTNFQANSSGYNFSYFPVIDGSYPCLSTSYVYIYIDIHIYIYTYTVYIHIHIYIYIHIPICSMYGLFNNIHPQYRPNVGKYTIHGAYGIYFISHILRSP